MKIAIRLDDIAPGMDRDKFTRFAEMLRARGIAPLMGIVPDNRDPMLSPDAAPGSASGGESEAFWAEVRALRDEDGWIPAMHGLTHVYSGKKGGLFPLNRLSEFAGLPLEKQTEMLRRGKEILASHGIETDIFMAPAHSYDRNTLRALAACGFTRVTDGFGTAPYVREGLTFCPISYRQDRSLAGGNGATTFVVHTNMMTEADFARYERVFAQQDMISYGELLAMPAAERGAAGDLREWLMADTKRRLVALRGLVRRGKK